MTAVQENLDIKDLHKRLGYSKVGVAPEKEKGMTTPELNSSLWGYCVFE